MRGTSGGPSYTSAVYSCTALAPAAATYCLANVDALPAALHGPLVELIHAPAESKSTLHVFAHTGPRGHAV